MGSKRPKCSCPKSTQKICKRISANKNKLDVEDIVAALTLQAQSKKDLSRCQPPKLKLKKKYRGRQKFKPCPQMNPPMYKRLQYISHCDSKPKRTKRRADTHSELDFSTRGDDDNNPYMKDRPPPPRITLPKPISTVQHTDSDKSIFNVPSPKTSGVNIPARRATLKPAEIKPPLPAKSGHALFAPHSGIVMNQDKDFAPDAVVIPGHEDGPSGIKKMKKGHCSGKGRGGVCTNKKCKKKKCRQMQARRLRQAARAAERGGGFEPCWSLSARSVGAARDGKPRTRNSQRVLADEDPCGVDNAQRPEHPEIPMSLKKGMFKTHSLTVLACTKDKRPGVHFGILMGTYNMYNSDKFGTRSRGRQALTMSVMAYCLAFHYHPKQWTMKLIDNLLDAGDRWFLQCADKVHDHSAYQGICEVLPFGKKQVLVLNGKRMQVLLCEPEVVGYTMSRDPTVYNLCRGMKAFFQENRAGVMLTRNLKVVIWKDKVCYYIFDPAGRNSQAYSNFSVGTGALINVIDLDGVADILLARSVLDDQKFVLAPVKLLRMVDETSEDDLQSDAELTQAEKASMSYRILSENCAVVNANMHLGDRCFEDTKFRQALTIAVAAMTYAKISPPNTWYTKTLDKILRLGNKLYIDCSNPNVLVDLTIDNIPNQITLGPYNCEIIIYRERVKGQLFTTKECLLNIRTGLEDFFSREYNAGILDFNNYALGVWKQKDMFYLFDPYPRTTDGERSIKTGKACCLMLLNPSAMAEAFTKNWDYLPASTQFDIHAFKVLKLKKKQPQTQLKISLSDDNTPTTKFKREVLGVGPEGRGDGKQIFTDVMPVEVLADRKQKIIDEERMGDIISLVDSIQEDFLPPIALKYKNMQPEPVEPKIANLDSPTVSVTQIVPPWPKPRDKTNEPPEPDPDYEPTPPPTPPPPPEPEGGVEEEEMGEEELDEEALKAKKEEEKRKKAEEEEARRKAEELPPPMPPPPPTPQEEVPLASEGGGGGGGVVSPAGRGGAGGLRAGEGGPGEETEVEVLQPVAVDRYILLTEDAKKRFKLRQIRRKMTAPLAELEQTEDSPEPKDELKKLHNFHDLPDTTQIIRGAHCIPEKEAIDVLPFAAIMAIVTSYKYSINTWTKGIVDFVIDTAKKLHANKKERFQLCPMHIIPKIGIGSQAFHATIDVVGEGATWQLEDVLTRKFFPKHDRGIITTTHYSCAFFRRNGLYYLFDGSCCSPMGLRDPKSKSGKACFLRFRNLHDLVCRIINNKDGILEDQQFILSKILVRRLLPEVRQTLPEDYDYETGKPKDAKSKMSKPEKPQKPGAADKRMSEVEPIETLSEPQQGYKKINGMYRIFGTTSLKSGKGAADKVQACHFVSLIAMLMAAMHPLRTWNEFMVDTCIEKGMEIFDKAGGNVSVCEKRVIRNLVLDGKCINVNIKKIIVVNENSEKTMEQYMKAVLNRLRYVIVKFPSCSLVICQSDGYYHLFDPYAPPEEDPEYVAEQDKVAGVAKSESKKSLKGEKGSSAYAGWTRYGSLDSLMNRISKSAKKGLDDPQFFTFELTSVKNAPRHIAYQYKLSPLFRPDQNPNLPYLKQKKPRPIVEEKMCWLNIETVPWSRMNYLNDCGLPRGTPKTLWKDWDIELPGDLFSLWGTIHPMDKRFDENDRGKQYLACCIVAIVMTEACNFNAWTGSFLDGIVIQGDKYFKQISKKVGGKRNYEVAIEDFDDTTEEMYPYSFTVKTEKIIFGFLYNIDPDRFSLSQALSLFFERHNIGILVSENKNLAFGRKGTTYFMFDCQSSGNPVFVPDQGAAYVLKCGSLNRLIYCMTLTINIRRHNYLFHLYSVTVKLSEEKEKEKEK